MRNVAASLLAAALLFTVPALASSGEISLHANNDVGNLKSLQRGARNYMNYCAGCHSAQYMRYSRLASDLQLSDDVLKENLMFGAGKIGGTMISAMPKDAAAEWFSAVPPDLTLTARSRGVDWIYAYLKSFYADDSKTFGVNNTVLPGASMPHVLWDLQGIQTADFEVHKNEDGNEERQFVGFHLAKPGKLSPEEYDGFVRDTVNFLDYIAEPMQLERQRLGIKVLAYLTLLFVLALALKKEFWKDVK